MCCDILGLADKNHNGSCCSGKNAINRFSIGSKLGTARSLPVSQFPLPSSILVPTISPSATLSSINSTPAKSSSSFGSSSHPDSSSGLSPSLGRRSSLSSSPTSSSAPSSNQPAVIGRTIAISVSTSVSAVVLIIAIFLIYQYLRKRRRKSEQNDAVQTQDPTKFHGSIEVYEPKEISGHQEYELQASARYLTQELPN